MLGYLVNRWTITRRFEEAGTGYLYRRRPDLPGFFVSEKQRQEALRIFAKRYWTLMLVVVAVTILGVLAIAVAAVILELGEPFLGVATTILVAVQLVLAVSQHRKWTQLLEASFAGCPTAAPEAEMGRWSDRFRRIMVRRSWPAHFAMTAGFGTGAWLLLPRTPETAFNHWLWFASFAGAFALSLLGVFIKARSTS